MAIPFTMRELENANRIAYHGWNVINKSNAHRLLLFYAVECGLKAVYLRKNNLDVMEAAVVPTTIFSHDINRILDELKAGEGLRLSSIHLKSYKKNGRDIARNCHISELNQVWRYGGKLLPPYDDASLESQLVKIVEWIRKELK